MNSGSSKPLGALWALASLLMSTTSAFAVAGNQSAGNGQIGQAHIDLAIPYGNTIAFIDYNNGTATGTFVPSTVNGQLKFLTAAHNVDSNNDGVLDGGQNALTFFFGGQPGQNGANATYRVVVQPAQIAVKADWATSGGSATNDLAVITFNVTDITVVQGGAVPTIAPVNDLNPAGQQGLVIGFGLSGDGTVALDPNNQNLPQQNQVDGILKAGWNTAGGVGVPGANGLPVVGATISPNSGTVVLVDYDRSTNNGNDFDPATSTFNDPLPAARQQLEGGTASGDSGSPFLIDSNNDGIFEVGGVLNGGDNPIQGQGVSQFGDISQYAPIFTEENKAFLQQQGVYLGTAYQGVTISGQMVIINLAATATGNPLANQALAEQINILRRMGDSSIQIVQQRARRVATGTSVLNAPGSAAEGTATHGFGGMATKTYEVYFEGSTANGDDSDAIHGQGGFEFKVSESLLLGFAVGTGSQNGDFGDDWISTTGYAIGVIDRYALSIAASWSDHEIDSRFQGSTITADSDMVAVELAAVGRYEMGGFVLSPSAAFRYTYGWLDNASITTGGVTTALTDQTFDQYRAEAGITASLKLDRDWGVIVPYFGAKGGYRDTTMDGSVSGGASAGAVLPFMTLQNVGGALQLVNLPTSIPGVGAAPAAQTDPGAVYGVLYAGAEFQWHEGHSIGFGASAAFDEVAGNSLGATIRFSAAF